MTWWPFKLGRAKSDRNCESPRSAWCGPLLIGLTVGWFLKPSPAGYAELLSPRRLDDALGILEKVPSGRQILENARKRFHARDNRELQGIFRWSGVSRTDAVLTRHFDPVTQSEVRERKVTVYLRRDQGLEDLVLDIAHELTHATSTPEWDPYDPKLTAVQYIHATIDGQGGEVAAVTQECRVSLELAQTYGTSSRRCHRYTTDGTSRSISSDRIREEFYRVGRHLGQMVQWLPEALQEFPLLSNQDPTLISSTGQAPYPVALYREFNEMTQIACENSRKRLEIASPDRRPASREATREFLSRRCR
jgi:hypothetical protein